MSVNRPGGLSSSEHSLCDTLDMLITEKAISIAVDVLYFIQDTFLLYREYLVEIGHVINEERPA